MKNLPRIILASRSPRRADLLRKMGFSFEIISRDIPEETCRLSNPIERVIDLSRRKAEAVLESVEEGLIIGADTIVYLDGEIFGKPVDKEEARHMLMKLAGRTHEVFTGFTILQVGGKQISDMERTAVTFRIWKPGRSMTMWQRVAPWTKREDTEFRIGVAFSWIASKGASTMSWVFH